MTAVVVPFPPAKRQDLVRSIARRALSLSPEAGEKHIVRSINLQHRTLCSKGVSLRDSHIEMNALEAAIRTVMWEAVMQPRETR